MDMRIYKFHVVKFYPFYKYTKIISTGKSVHPCTAFRFAALARGYQHPAPNGAMKEAPQPPKGE
jgi:hypothetical protein